MWVGKPPSSSSLHLPRWLSHVGHTHGTLGCCSWNLSQKPLQESPFPPSSKGEGRESVQGFKGSWLWWLHWHGPSPNSIRILGITALWGSRGAAKMTVATAPVRNRAKQQGKDFYITQTSPSHLQGAQGAATGINPGRQGCAGGICLLPSCCYFLQAGTANPPPWDSSTGIGTWFWQLQAWQDRGPGRPWNTDGEKHKRKRSWSAGALWFGSRGALSRTWEVQPRSGELSTLFFPLFLFSWMSLRNAWNHLPPWAMILKVTKRALIWGKNWVWIPWPWDWCFRMSVQRLGISGN